MVNFRNTVSLLSLVAGFATAINNEGNNAKRYLPVKESSQNSLDEPATATSTKAEETSAAATSVGTYTFVPTTTAEASAVETSTGVHAVPMTPVIESSDSALAAPTTSAAPTTTVDASSSIKDWGTTGQATLDAPVTEASETALATPSSPTYVYAPSTAVVESSQSSLAVPTHQQSSAPAFSWAPTTSEEAQQPTYVYVPSSSSSETATPIIVPIASSSSAAPATPTGNVPLFYTGPAAPSTTAELTAAGVTPAAVPSAAMSSMHTVWPGPSDYNKPASASEPISTATVIPVEPGVSIATVIPTPNTRTLPFTMAPLETTLATSVSMIPSTLCPESETKCHTVFITPQPMTATSSASASEDGIMTLNGHTISMGAATLAAAPNKVTGSASGAGYQAPGASGTAALQKGAASSMKVGMGGLLGVVVGLVVLVL